MTKQSKNNQNKKGQNHNDFARLPTLSNNIHGPSLTMYTDGACIRQGGRGAWAGIVLNTTKNVAEVECTGTYENTTNQRMELIAAVEMLEMLVQPCIVTLVSDSKYVVDGANNWVHGWVKNNWKRNKDEGVFNYDLWRRMLVQIHRHRVLFKWVKGHAGDKWNNYCDRLATRAVNATDAKYDDNYPNIVSYIKLPDSILSFYKNGQIPPPLPTDRQADKPTMPKNAPTDVYMAFSEKTEGSVRWAVHFYSEGKVASTLRGNMADRKKHDIIMHVMRLIFMMKPNTSKYVSIYTPDKDAYALFLAIKSNIKKVTEYDGLASKFKANLSTFSMQGEEDKTALILRAV